MKILEDECNTQKHRLKDLEKENDILRQQQTLQSQKLVFNVNEIEKDIKKVERDLANHQYSTHMVITELTKKLTELILNVVETHINSMKKQIIKTL
jgi:hypothetical protein